LPPDKAAFVAGYRDGGGNPAWEEHFLNVVIPCESRWSWTPSEEAKHLSVAQFHPDSWRRAAAHTGLADPAKLYDVGANVAWWSSHITSPGGTGGWPACWWAGP